MNIRFGTGGSPLPFCITGGHPILFGVPWEMVRASSHGNGRWYQNSASNASIIACAEHPVPPQV